MGFSRKFGSRPGDDLKLWLSKPDVYWPREKGIKKFKTLRRERRRTAMQGNGGSGNEAVFAGAPQEVTAEDVAHIFRESIQKR